MSVKIIVRSCSRMTSYLSPYKIHSNKSRQYWRGFKFASNEPLKNENTGALYKQFKFQNEPWKNTIRDFLKIFGLWIAINNFRSTSRWKSVRRGKFFFLISSYFFHIFFALFGGVCWMEGGWVVCLNTMSLLTGCTRFELIVERRWTLRRNGWLRISLIWLIVNDRYIFVIYISWYIIGRMNIEILYRKKRTNPNHHVARAPRGW